MTILSNILFLAGYIIEHTEFWLLNILIISCFFMEFEIIILDCKRMEREFSDYKKMGIHLNQFMGSSSSIGAKRVRNVCVAFRAASEQNNRAGCVPCFFFYLLNTRACYIPSYLSHCIQIINILISHSHARMFELS